MNKENEISDLIGESRGIKILVFVIMSIVAALITAMIASFFSISEQKKKDRSGKMQ